MTQTIYTNRTDYPYAGSPVVVIHSVERHVHGNGIKLLVFGELLIAAKERIYAYEMKLNTLKVLVMTPLVPPSTGLHLAVSKWIYNKGQYDNYASIDIYNMDGTEETASRGTLPYNGSLWLDFIAQGE